MHLTQAAEPAIVPRREDPHAQVVPSFIVAKLTTSIKYKSAAILPSELIGWSRPFDLTESAKQDLCNIIVRRLRPRAEWLWAQPTGVRLCDEWRAALLQA